MIKKEKLIQKMGFKIKNIKFKHKNSILKYYIIYYKFKKKQIIIKFFCFILLYNF